MAHAHSSAHRHGVDPGGDGPGAHPDGAHAGGADPAERFRARGMRWTAQRAEILAVVQRLGHATPDEVAAHAPDVDPATVYRTLEALEQVGLIGHAHLGHGAPSYRPADDSHIHVVCHVCGTVVDPPHDLARELVQRLADERGFTVDLPHLVVFGSCADCRAGAAGTATK
jgi:Fur family ferric uptake transcriptional regulator